MVVLTVMEQSQLKYSIQVDPMENEVIFIILSLFSLQPEGVHD